MTFTNWKININLNNKVYPIHYSYRNDMTFQDLLEYFAYLCSELNICQCYHFQGIIFHIWHEGYRNTAFPKSCQTLSCSF